MDFAYKIQMIDVISGVRLDHMARAFYLRKVKRHNRATIKRVLIIVFNLGMNVLRTSCQGRRCPYNAGFRGLYILISNILSAWYTIRLYVNM